MSEADKLRVIKHFLLAAPPGEFEDVLMDVRILVDDDDLLNSGALEFFYKYNVEQLIPVDIPDSEKQLVLCSFAQVDKDDISSFYNPYDNNILKIDHTKGKVMDVVENTSVEYSEKQLSQCKMLQEEISKYVQKTYNHGLVTVYPSQDENKFVCVITASKFNEKNLWSGRWRGVHSIEFKDETNVELTGTAKVNVHYYENGNVQLNTSRDHLVTCKGSDIGAEIVKVLDACENSFQTNIDETCMSLSEVFKSLRRKLPLSGNVFDFESGSRKMLIS